MNGIELFVGAGGMALGASWAGLNPLAVVDWDKWACETIRDNALRGIAPFKKWPLTEGDVRSFDYSSFVGAVDVVTGGPPCQPFSMGGKHRAFSDTRDMFPEAVRSVRELRPKAFVFENVRGLTRQSFNRYFEYIRLQLRHPTLVARPSEDWSEHMTRLEEYESSNAETGLSYQVLTKVLNAADFGVPQKRERVFFVGIRSDLGASWHFPEPTHSRDALLWSKYVTGDYWERHSVKSISESAQINVTALTKRHAAEPEKLAWRTVRDALKDLPDPRSPSGRRLPNHRFQPGAKAYPGHTGSYIDEPAKTLKAGVHGVPGGENMLRYPDGSVRYFTVRESARLQTFPDEMVLHGSWSEAMRQLGNAVPAELARIVLSSVVESLRKID